MNNKQIRRYKGLINKKLDSMGISKELRFQQVCLKPTAVNKDGKIEVMNLPRYVAQSVRRQMRNQLIASGPKVIEAFLKMDVSRFKSGKVGQ